MPVLHGISLSNYLLTLVNVENVEKIRHGDMNVKDVVVRKNNANSKWVSKTAASGRNPVWYKSIGLITFLLYTTKEGVVFFRIMNGQFVGGKAGVKSGQSNSIAFQKSPGSTYLTIKDRYFTCLISEFYNTTQQMVKSGLIPEEFFAIAKQFMALEKQQENILNFGREHWKDTHNSLKRLSKQIDNLSQRDLFDKGLGDLDNIMKKQINKSKYLKQLPGYYKKGRELYKATQSIESAVEFISKRAKDMVNSGVFKGLDKDVFKVIDKVNDFSSPKQKILSVVDSSKLKALQKIGSFGSNIVPGGKMVKLATKTAIKVV